MTWANRYIVNENVTEDIDEIQYILLLIIKSTMDTVRNNKAKQTISNGLCIRSLATIPRTS